MRNSAFSFIVTLVIASSCFYAGKLTERNSWSVIFSHGPRIDQLHDPWTQRTVWTDKHWSEWTGLNKQQVDVQPTDRLASVAHWGSEYGGAFYPDTRLSISGDRRTVILQLGHHLNSEHFTEACRQPWMVRANPDGTLSVKIAKASE